MQEGERDPDATRRVVKPGPGGGPRSARDTEVAKSVSSMGVRTGRPPATKSVKAADKPVTTTSSPS